MAAVDFKSYMTKICILGIFSHQFRYSQRLCLVTILLININIWMNLYTAILSLGIAVYLQIKCGKKPALNLTKKDSKQYNCIVNIESQPDIIVL